jgi:hypothetical protein
VRLQVELGPPQVPEEIADPVTRCRHAAAVARLHEGKLHERFGDARRAEVSTQSRKVVPQSLRPNGRLSPVSELAHARVCPVLAGGTLTTLPGVESLYHQGYLHECTLQDMLRMRAAYWTMSCTSACAQALPD